MKFITLVFKEKYQTFVVLIILGLITGGIHVGLLVAINKIIGGLLKEADNQLQTFNYALLLLLLYLVLNKILTKSVIEISQKVIHDLRMLLVRSILKSSYERVVLAKEGEFFKSAVTKDTVALSRAALSSINLITSAVTLVGCLVYLGFLSFQILAIVLAVTLMGIGVYSLNLYNCRQNLRQARESEDLLFYHVGQVIDGFRELKVNSLKGQSLIEGPLVKSSGDSYKYAVKGLDGYFNNGMIGQSLFYLAMILLLFSGTSWFHLQPIVLVNCVVIMLYLIGPLEMILAMLPEIGVGNVAAQRLNEMILLDEAQKTDILQAVKQDFSELAFNSVSYSYVTSDFFNGPGFVLGPIDLVVKKGTITFIYGGNGSGKTTLLHILLGLIKGYQGELHLNGQLVKENESISSLFAVVFSDFHLFDTLYGIKGMTSDKVNNYLKLFELHNKVTFEDGRFSTIDLSAGQRKRLALIAALLENRPLLILDEWAADQDPFFRAKFYAVILPALKEEGFTIIAITHDDKYFDTSDVLYRMESGQLTIEKNISV